MTIELIKAGESRKPKLSVSPSKYSETIAFIEEHELDDPAKLSDRFPSLFLDCDPLYFARAIAPRLRRGEVVSLPRRRWHRGD